MQLIAALIVIGIFVLILGGCLYLASRQKPKGQHYGSWDQVLDPQFRGSAFDVNEKLNAESCPYDSTNSPRITVTACPPR